ncbi:hypothetical protein IB237_23315 [Agrobacterium sp. AGB01]|uniref:hypothetical protein n=1 Tax=Agrobacterium sp. AGB01 TaxID=2769302 RepID=UPI00177C4144|nr:hypothetical protein [Agrobacterium sp. AGB01]MBD9390134.1 hypothetical protein [Agrobacterium sp. AGB01]
MKDVLVTEAGFYGGQFLKPGQTYRADDVDDATVNIKDMNKDELVAEAVKRGIEPPSNATKADLVKLLSGDSDD